MSWLNKSKSGPNEASSSSKKPACPTDFDILKKNHKFLRTEEDDDGSWEAKLAKKYYDRLYKEYVIAELAGYKENKVCFQRPMKISCKK